MKGKDPPMGRYQKLEISIIIRTADCSMKMPSGTAISSRSTSVMTVESDSAYRLEVDVVTDGQASKELLVAQRIGDCKK